jgi:hypothetical protein
MRIHPPFFEVPPPKKERYMYIRSHAFILQVARHCQRAEKKDCGWGKKIKSRQEESKYIYISANLARPKTTRVYLPCCLGSLSDADILDCDNLSASGPSCYCFSSFFFEDDEWCGRVSINLIGQREK